jgi:hypothetical protein
MHYPENPGVRIAAVLCDRYRNRVGQPRQGSWGPLRGCRLRAESVAYSAGRLDRYGGTPLQLAWIL